MSGLFLAVCNRALEAGLLVAAVLLARLILRNAPKYIHCLLWLLVAARLVLPSFPVSHLSLLPDAQILQPAGGSTNLSVNLHIPSAGTAPSPYQAVQGVSVGLGSRCVEIFALLWLLGMAALVGCALCSWWRLRRRVAEAVRCDDGLWESGEIDSPFLLGLFRPRIYVPLGLAGEARDYVAAHERSHLARRDHWWKPLGFLLLAAYWFHPLMWAAYVLLCRDIEAACDERVLRDLGAEARGPYAQALLQCSVRQRAVTACPLAFGETGVKVRIKNILNYKKPAFWVVLASLILCAAVAVCFLTDPKGTKSEPANPQDEGPELVVVPSTAGPVSGVGLFHATYTGGPLLCQAPTLSSLFVDGSYYASVTEADGALEILYRDESAPFLGELAEEKTYSRIDFLLLVPTFHTPSEELVPDTITSVEGRTYTQQRTDDGPDTFTIWELTHADGSTWLWLSPGGQEQQVRIYELLDLSISRTLHVGSVAALWTYADHAPALALRFEGAFDLAYLTAEDGTLSATPPWTREQETAPAQRLTIAPGTTVYWTPGADRGEYTLTFAIERTDGSEYRDRVMLRPMSKCQGFNNATTYAVSQDWLGALSSRFHLTSLSTDPDFSELVVTYQPRK